MVLWGAQAGIAQRAACPWHLDSVAACSAFETARGSQRLSQQSPAGLRSSTQSVSVRHCPAPPGAPASAEV